MSAPEFALDSSSDPVNISPVRIWAEIETHENKGFDVVANASALSSVVEHYLHTVAGNRDLPKYQSVNGEPELLCPDFRPDPGAKITRSTRRFTRIGRGLYRYGGTGEIYHCRKVSGRNRWLKLHTTNRVTAMAIAALTSYSEAQNGNHQVAVVDDVLAKTPVAISEGQVQPVPLLPISSAPAPTSPSQAPPSPARRRSMTIRALIEELKSQCKHLAPSTQKIRETYLNVLIQHLDADADVSTITPSVIRKVRGGLTQGRKPTTVNDIMSKALRPLLALAVELQLLEKCPMESLKPLKKERAIRLQPTWDEALSILAEVDASAPDSGELLRCIVFFGIGQAELKEVMGEHFDLAKDCVHFFRGKTRKEFIVPIYPHAREFVTALKEADRLAAGAKVFTWRNPRKALESACKKLRLPLYSPRTLRRTFIIKCLEAGVDPRVVAAWQGHADARLILTTYGNFLSADHVKSQVAKLA